jgi:hypothetical protein
MNMKKSLVLEISLLALFVAAPGCTKPGSSGGSGGSGAATGGSHGTGGSNGTGTGGSNTTGTGGSNGTGTGGTTTTTGTGGTTTTTGTGGTTTTTGTGGTTTTGTGGTTTTGATGGTTGGGTGGAAGAAVVQKDCATKTVVMNPVFMNFENYTGTGTMTAANYATAFGGTTVNSGTAYAGFYPYPEVAGGPEPTLALVAGHAPSNWAGSESFSAVQWGMGGGIWMACANASAYNGISLWVRGTAPTSTFSFSISMDSTQLPDATNAAGGGICPGTKDNCVDPVKSNLPITTDWTQVQILWSDFTPGNSGGTAVVPNGDNIVGMGWTVGLQFHLDPSVAADAAGPYIGIPAAVRIDIDDVSFIM